MNNLVLLLQIAAHQAKTDLATERREESAILRRELQPLTGEEDDYSTDADFERRHTDPCEGYFR